MKLLVLIVVIAFTAVHGAPDPRGIDEKLKALEEQLAAVEKQYAPKENKLAFGDTAGRWEPQKRMVAWQPMKRNFDERAPLLHAVEARLAEVLRAGERLGISPEEVLADLRARNQFN